MAVCHYPAKTVTLGSCDSRIVVETWGYRWQSGSLHTAANYLHKSCATGEVNGVSPAHPFVAFIPAGTSAPSVSFHFASFWRVWCFQRRKSSTNPPMTIQSNPNLIRKLFVCNLCSHTNQQYQLVQQRDTPCPTGQTQSWYSSWIQRKTYGRAHSLYTKRVKRI